MSNDSAPKRRRPFGSPEEDTFIAVQRTADVLARSVEKILRSADISPTQYNVLRILRGAPEGLQCSEIGRRMITRDPDITRLLDRLEKRTLIARHRDTKDRRIVVTRITPEGLKCLADLDGPVNEVHKAQLGHLGNERLHSLKELLEVARMNLA